MEASSNQIKDAQTSNGIKDPMCLVDIPMPSANESQSDTTTSKDAIPLTNTNPIGPSPGEMGNSSSERSQNDMHRQLNLISAPPPPPPEHVHEPKSTLSANITITTTTQRTVNISFLSNNFKIGNNLCEISNFLYSIFQQEIVNSLTNDASWKAKVKYTQVK